MLLTLWAAGTGSALGQGANATGPPPPTPVASGPVPSGPIVPVPILKAQVATAADALKDISRTVRSDSLNDAQIKAARDALPPVQAKLAGAIAGLTPYMGFVQARLAQLGPAPGPGQTPDSPENAKSRHDLSRFEQDIGAPLKQAGLLQVEAGQDADVLDARQRQQDAARLWAHSRSILNPRLWIESGTALPHDVQRLRDVLMDEVGAVDQAARSSSTALWLVLSALGALILAVPVRVLLNRLAYSQIGAIVPGTRLRRTLLALWLVAIATLTPLSALLLLHTAFDAADAITPAFAGLAPLLIRVVVFAAGFEGLGRALLSPGRSSWRLAPIPDAVVRRLMAFPAMVGVAAGVAALVRGVNAALGASQPTTIASDGLFTLLELAAVGGALFAVGRVRGERLAEAVEDTSPHEAESRLPWIIAALLAWLTLTAALLAVVLGYLELAARLMGEMIWIATVLASLFLLLRLVDDVFPTVLSPERPVGRFLQIAIGLSKGALEQIAVLASGLLRLILLLLGWAVILAPFGTGAGDVFGRIASSRLAFHIGQVPVSPGLIFGAASVFLIGLLITRAIRGWLERSYLPKTRIDVGVRTSLGAGVTYAGGLIALLLTCSYVGLSLDKIALFASALSVGIGFGLQSVIGNFVSGLILLAERPVKVGDWIAIGELEGDIRKINVRATEIEMQDRSKLIVPNTDLISKTVRNISHSGSVGRLRIVLKVVDSADPAAVRALLCARVEAHPDVLRDPAPILLLTDVRDGALEFSLFAYVDSPRVAGQVKSELLFQIVPDLRAQGIGLASSTPVVNVGMPARSPDAPVVTSADGAD